MIHYKNNGLVFARSFMMVVLLWCLVLVLFSWNIQEVWSFRLPLQEAKYQQERSVTPSRKSMAFAATTSIATTTTAAAATRTTTATGGLKATTLFASKSSSLSNIKEKEEENINNGNNENDKNNVAKNMIRPCFYTMKTSPHRKQRILLNDLTIGQPLVGCIVQELLDGVTGPKVFLECGIGRVDKKNNWHIVNGMLRLGGKQSKLSVTKKRVARLRKKKEIPCYVSRIQLECGRLEVVLNQEDVQLLLQQQKNKQPMISISSIVPQQQQEEDSQQQQQQQQQQELIGAVKIVRPYGVLVDIGANRLGLLHIRKVAELYGHYIDKEQGLIDAGLNPGERIRVVAIENKKRRLFLDFPQTVKIEAEKQRLQQQGEKDKETVRTNNNNNNNNKLATEQQQQQDLSNDKIRDQQTPVATTTTAKTTTDYLSEQEAAAWAEYAADEYKQEENDDDEDDEYDEDRAIEDSLGLGSW